MMSTQTDVQDSKRTGGRTKAWREMAGPRARVGEVRLERVTLELPEEDYDLLDLYALYRNARAKALGDKIRAWSRKSMAESILSDHLESLRRDLAEMFEAVGPLPREADFAHIPPGTERRDQLRAAMEKYAKRVLAWDKKSVSKNGQ